jgi:seryl-tRNA synthetase
LPLELFPFARPTAVTGDNAGTDNNMRARGEPADMVDDLEQVMKQRRSLQKALAELEARYEKRPSETLARMIEQLKAELAHRKERS